jgi:hypothetical protein
MKPLNFNNHFILRSFTKKSEKTMSSTIFYSKTPIRRNQPMSVLVHRLKTVADTVRNLGKEEVVQKKHSSTVISYDFDGIKATYDSYYDDKTITIEGAGTVHLSMNRNESYFDINMNVLTRLESKLSITHNTKAAA